MSADEIREALRDQPREVALRWCSHDCAECVGCATRLLPADVTAFDWLKAMSH